MSTSLQTSSAKFSSFFLFSVRPISLEQLMTKGFECVALRGLMQNSFYLQIQSFQITVCYVSSAIWRCHAEIV